MNTVLIDILFDDKGHITKTQINHVSEYNKVMRLNLYPMSVMDVKSTIFHFVNKVSHCEVVS